jgi:transposase InsO family protein
MWQQQIPIEQIAATVEKDRATIYRWLKAIRRQGIKEFLWRKKTCKQRRPHARTPEYIAQKIVDIRNQWGYCGFKIQKELQANHRYGHGRLAGLPIKLSLATIYRILHERFTKHAVGVQRYTKHQPIVKAYSPREIVEHDTVDLGGGKYAYTSIDVFTKEPVVYIGTDLTMATGKTAFIYQKAYYGTVTLHQSDGGSEFQTDFVGAVKQTGSQHRYSRPYKKNEQAHIENFNKSLRSECFPGNNYEQESVTELQQLANSYCEWFINQRWHMGLPDAMTPAQFATYYQEDPESATMELTKLHDRVRSRHYAGSGLGRRIWG